jgi:DNA-binding transcriptional LysR family regulator
MPEFQMDRLNAMELFVRVVETGSFSAVAREMDMTQPTVSKQLAGLEARLKTRLLNRSTRQLSLTEAGTSYYEACKRILDGVREAEGNLGKLQGRLTGTLRLNTSISMGQMYVAPLAIKFQKAHPEIEIDLQLQDRFVDLVEEGIDVAIRVGRLTDSTLVARRLGRARRVTIATPGYLKKHGTPKVPQDLASHNCIIYQYLSTGNEWLFQGPEGEIRVKVSGSFRANNGEAIGQAVMADLGIAVAPEWMVHDAIAAGRIKAVLPDFAPTPLEINAVFTSARHVSTKVRAFIEFLQSEFPNYPALRST